MTPILCDWEHDADDAMPGETGYAEATCERFDLMEEVWVAACDECAADAQPENLRTLGSE